jgi:hypothetical protein
MVGGFVLLPSAELSGLAMKNTAVRLALAIYPPEFRRRFGIELLTTMADASDALGTATPNEPGATNLPDSKPNNLANIERAEEPTKEGSPPAGQAVTAEASAPILNLMHLDYRDVLNLAQYGLRARLRSMIPEANSPSRKQRRLSTWLLLAGTLAMAYKLGAFRTPNDVDRQHATSKGLNFHASITNNLKVWRYQFGDLFRNNTPTGGDMGSHVWAADALRRDVLPQWRLTGWSNDWYAGMPLLSFYFPLPMLAIAALSVILPFGVAFKIVTALGSLALPLVTRKAMLRFGMPTSAATISALGTFAVLFGRFYDWTGYGGTLFSTMSGEFSFSLSSCLAVAFLGSFAHLLKSGSGRGRSALLLAGAGLCHLLPTIWALVGALVIALVHLDQHNFRRQVRDGAVVATLGAGLAGFWLLPFAANLEYTNSMGWERKRNFLDSLFPFTVAKPLPDSTLALLATACCAFTVASSLFFVTKALLSQQDTRSRVLSCFGGACAIGAAVAWWSQARGAVIGAIVLLWVGLGAIASWKAVEFDRPGYCLGILWVVCGVVFVQAPEFRLWNARVLPFWFLTMFLITGIGSVHIVRFLARGANWLAQGHLRTLGIDGRVGIAVAAVVVFVAVGLPVGLAPAALPIPKYAKGMIGLQTVKSSTDRSSAPAWTAHNYGGYEGQPAWPEYKGVMDTATEIGKAVGCGRAMWEYEEKTIEKYGTTLALTLLPYWTKGCIGSLEGVYYESSATTPVHFRNASLVNAPRNDGLNGEQKVSGLSNPQRNLFYPSFDLETGINELRAMGVRYFLAVSNVAVAAAERSPQLRAVGTSPALDPATQAPRTQWHFYEIANHALVAPITERPVVVRGVGQAQDDGWLDTSMAALNDRARYPKTLVSDGPKEWERADVTIVKRPIDTTYGTGVHLSGSALRPALQTLKSCWERQAAQSLETKEPKETKETQGNTATPHTEAPPSSLSQRLANYSYAPPLVADTSSPIGRVVSGAKGTQLEGNRRSPKLSAANQTMVDQACANPAATPVGLAAVQPSLPTTTISRIHQTRNSISFHTSTPGVPVVVRLSYFPNWKAHAAKGPFRTFPNFMTVIPTGNEVTLTYGRRPIDLAGELATCASLAVVLFGWIRLKRRQNADDPCPGLRAGLRPNGVDGAR